MTKHGWIVLVAWIALGCGDDGSTTIDGGDAADGGFVVADGNVDGDGGSVTEDGGGGLDASTGPRVLVHLRATHAPVPHAPGTSGQTPRDWESGIRSLALLRTRDDPDPMLVFSHGDGHVVASYADGADTVVGSAPIEALELGTYTWARAVHTFVRFTVDATMHSSFGATPGEIEDLLVISDRTTLDGMEYARGHYRFEFRALGMSFPTMGEGLFVPTATSAGLTMTVEDGETAYYFPALVQVVPITEDAQFIFEVNVHEGFRWTDETAAGYAAGVFDATPTGTEPIVQVGANGYDYFVE